MDSKPPPPKHLVGVSAGISPTLKPQVQLPGPSPLISISALRGGPGRAKDAPTTGKCQRLRATSPGTGDKAQRSFPSYPSLCVVLSWVNKGRLGASSKLYGEGRVFVVSCFLDHKRGGGAAGRGKEFLDPHSLPGSQTSSKVEHCQEVSDNDNQRGRWQEGLWEGAHIHTYTHTRFSHTRHAHMHTFTPTC